MERVRTQADVREIFAARNRIRRLEAKMVKSGRMDIQAQRQIAETRSRILHKYNIVL